MRRLLLFARRPLLGRVKTRLARSLGPEQVLTLYRAFLADQARFLQPMARRYSLEVWLDGPWSPEPDDPLADDGFTLREQGVGDLGVRLLRAFRSCHAAGAGATVVIAADSPSLPEHFVHDAFSALEQGADAVAAPATDGGYVLIGMRRPHAELFDDVAWSSSEVMRVTSERAVHAGIDLRLLETWYDVDEPQALKRLARDLSGPGIRRAPATAAVLSELELG
jgi:rSAM/selenodomain-associated transferase 1